MAAALFGVLAMLFVGGTMLMIWLVLPLKLVSLRRRMDGIDRERTSDQEWRRQIDALTRRITQLEDSLRERPATLESPAERVPPVAVSPAVRPPFTSAAAPATMPPAMASPQPAAAIGVALPRTIPSPHRPPAADHGEPQSSPAWEIVVGASWLNRIGVFALVVGIALGVAYTVGRTGPAGRVAIGYATSALLLGVGVWLERRPTYRSYAYGLVAGGWAGIYFTTYAAHAVEAARVIDSDVVATVALIATAAGMVAHSLRYRSQTVTGLAYFIAYATLALTPLDGFALVATVPLSASLLIVAERFGWSQVATIGIVSTYGVFGLRDAIFPGRIEADSLAPYLALAAYWLTFEIGDIAAHRGRRADADRPAPLFALNAIGFIGALLLQLPSSDPVRFSSVLIGAAGGYLVTAAVRARLLGPVQPAAAGIESVFSDASKTAVGLAAGLVMWAINLRLSGSRELIGLLMTSEMLFAAGIVFGDRIIRMFGAGAGAIVALRALTLVKASSALIVWPWSMHVWTPAVALVAMTFYANREVVRTRRLEPLGIEWGYTPVASLLLLQILLGETSLPYAGLSLVAAAFVLVELGIWRAPEYRYQGYVFGAFGFAAVLDRHLGRGSGLDPDALAAEAWRVLPIVSALAYAAAARLARRRQPAEGIEMRAAAGLAACAAAATLMLFEWRVAPPLQAAPLWAATALVLVGVGVWRRIPLLVSQGYVLAMAAALRGMGPIVIAPPLEAGLAAVRSAGLVIFASFASGALGRRSLSGRSDALAQIEDTLRLMTLIAASTALVVLIFRESQPSVITLALGLAGVLLVVAGLALGERVLRVSGLAVFAIGITRLFASDLVQLEGLARIGSFIVSGLALLGVSWVYTRFREQIKQLL